MQGEDPKDSKEYWMGKVDALKEENDRLAWMLQTNALTRREIPSDFDGTYIAGAGVATTTQTTTTQVGIIVDRLVLPIGATVFFAGLLLEVLATHYVLAIAGAVLIATYLLVRSRKRH